MPSDLPPIHPHPWVVKHREHPTLLDLLREPVELCFNLREFHTSIMNGVSFEPIKGSHAETFMSLIANEVGPHGPWGENERQHDPLYVLTMLGLHVRDYLAVAINNLASAAMLVRSGEYLFSIAPVVRSSAECSTTVTWLLDTRIDPRQHAARVMLDRAASFQQQKATLPRTGDTGARRGLKELEDSIRQFFHAAEIDNLKGSGWDKHASLANESLLGLEARWRALGELQDQGSEYQRMYGGLSLLSHPNITQLELLQRDGSYYVDEEGLRRLLWVGVLAYREAMRRALTFFGFRENDDPIGTMDEMLRRVYPEGFDVPKA